MREINKKLKVLTRTNKVIIKEPEIIAVTPEIQKKMDKIGKLLLKKTS